MLCYMPATNGRVTHQQQQQALPAAAASLQRGIAACKCPAPATARHSQSSPTNAPRCACGSSSGRSCCARCSGGARYPRRNAAPLRVVAFKDDKQREEPLAAAVGDTIKAKLGQLFHEAQAGTLSRRRGLVATEPKARLGPWTHEVGPLGDQEVDIRVTHNGLCHSDVHMRDNDWGFSRYPFIPGHEVVGTVLAVGKGVKTLEPGMRVGVGWIRDSCRCCAACLTGQENVCERGYTGLIVNGNHGGFQDIMRAPADFTYRIPEGLPSAEAAPLLCAGVTVYAPLKRHVSHPGSRVAVLGIGGLGHLALQFAAAMGAVVTAIDMDPSKEQEAHSLGASDFITWGEATADTRHDGSFDVLLNCASASIDTGKLMALLAPNGTLVQVGMPNLSSVMTVPLIHLVNGQRHVAGSIVGGRAVMHEMLNLAAAKGIKPMVEIMPMDKVNEAIDKMLAGKVRYRIVLTNEHGIDGNM